MKRLFCIGVVLLGFLAACTRQQTDFLSPTDVHDAEYALLIDSVEAVFDGSKYHDFTDSVVSPALDFYSKSDTPRDYWMQARCHYLTGCLLFDNNKLSEKATAHFVEALNILDTHFDAHQVPVGRLYSKICIILSRLAFNFSDEQCSTKFARLGLDCASTVGDTAWMLRSMANLGLLYERFGKPGEGDTAYFYCDEGLRIANADRYPYETALLENSLANCLRHSHDYDSAIYYFEKSFALVDSDCQLFHKNAIEKAFVHYRARDYAAALADLEVAYQSKDENIKTQAAYGLADCYEELGDTLRAMPYYALVKAQEEKRVTELNHNAEVLSVLNAYLKEREPQKGGKTLLWVLVFLAMAATFAGYHHVYRKRMTRKHEAIERDLHEAHGALEMQAQEALRMKVQAIYGDKRNNTFSRILEVFNEAYPDALTKLKAAHPDLNETELDICVLSMFPFRTKEIADILDLRENTVSKYRTAIKRKTQTDSFEALWKRFLR